MTTEAKQAVLINSIVDAVGRRLEPELAKIGEQLAAIAVNGASTLARIDILDSAVASGGPAAKRAVRTGAAKKAPAKGGAAAADGGSNPGKVTNALLYCRYIMANDIDDAQAVYGTEENIQAIMADAREGKSLGRINRETNPTAWWSTVGAGLWKVVLSDDQKTEIRTQFATWKDDNARNDAEPQLNEDEVDGDGE